MWILKALLIVVLLFTAPAILSTIILIISESEAIKGTIARVVLAPLAFIFGGGIGGLGFGVLWGLLYILIRVSGAPEDVLKAMENQSGSVSLIGGSIGGVGLGIATLIKPEALQEAIDSMNEGNPGGCLFAFVAGLVFVYWLFQIFG